MVAVAVVNVGVTVFDEVCCGSGAEVYRDVIRFAVDGVPPRVEIYNDVFGVVPDGIPAVARVYRHVLREVQNAVVFAAAGNHYVFAGVVYRVTARAANYG